MATTECISLHVGQAGVRLASPVWDFLCEEEGITVDGMVNGAKVRDDNQCSPTKFFHDNARGKHTPRAIVVDMDPDRVNVLRRSCLRDLFNGKQLLANRKGAECNYAAGRYSLGRASIDVVMDQVRLQAEQCDALQDFIVYNAMGGGTGSGFTALILEQLSQDYGKTGKLQYSISSLREFQIAVYEGYNNLLHINATADYSDVVVLFDNGALVERCRKALGVEQPRYETLNQLVASVVSASTLPMRTGRGTYGTKRLASELVPCPAMHYPIANYGPVRPVKEHVDIDNSRASWKLARDARVSLDNLTKSCFKHYTAMARADVRLGKSMAVLMAYRGVKRDTYYIPDPIASLGKDLNHESVSWRPCHYRSVNCPSSQPTLATTRVTGERAQTLMVPQDRALCVLNNNTAIKNTWDGHLVKLESLMQERKYFHLYTAEGMEEEEFEMARDNAQSLVEEFGSVDF